MSFRHMWDGIRLHHQPHQGHDGHGASAAPWLDSPQHSAIDTGDNSAGDGGNGLFSGAEVDAAVAMFNPFNAAFAGFHGTADAHQSNMVQIDQHATQIAGVGGNGGNDNAAVGGDVSVLKPASGSGNAWLDSGVLHTGANEAGNGGDGYFYGGIIHASLAVYEPINITVTAGYDSSAQADQTNNVVFNQSAVQMAGIGGNGGNGNIASGGNVGIASSGSGVIATGDNNAGNGGDGHFSGMLVDAPVVIYNPINIAVAGFGGTAHASQSNTVEIDQSAIQIAGVGGNGGNGNAAVGGNLSTLGSGSGSGNVGNHGELIQTGASHAGNGGDGHFYGGLVHACFALYDPVNIAVAGYNSNAYASQINNVDLNQSSHQAAGVRGERRFRQRRSWGKWKHCLRRLLGRLRRDRDWGQRRRQWRQRPRLGHPHRCQRRDLRSDQHCYRRSPFHGRGGSDQQRALRSERGPDRRSRRGRWPRQRRVGG